MRHASIHFLVPEMIHDPLRVSGGNVYDLRVVEELRDAGRNVRLVAVEPCVGALAARLSELPADALALIDGILVADDPGAVQMHARRLAVLILAHLPATEQERPAFRAAAAVITTSMWTRSRMLDANFAAPNRIVVARPGSRPAPAVAASPGGNRLLCVGVVAPHKGQDVLVRALSGLRGLRGWTCTMIGSLTMAPGYVKALRRSIADAGLRERITLTGTLDETSLRTAYRHTDLLVHPSLGESYGMVIAEAQAHAIPVIASHVGGVSEAVLNRETAHLVPAANDSALRSALTSWLSDPLLREHMKTAALEARTAAPTWRDTANAILGVCDRLTSRREASGNGREVA